MSQDGIPRVRRFFDEHTHQYLDRYLDSATTLYRKKNAFLARYVTYDPPASPNVLDVGAGGGVWSDLFLDDYPRAQLVGLDISWAMLGKNHPRPGKSLVMAGATRLPFSHSCFDLISIDALMHHLIDYGGYSATVLRIAEFLRSLPTLLKPGGKIIIREVYHESVVQDAAFSRILFMVSTLRLPQFLSSRLRAFGIRSQGAGACFLTRKQWALLISQSGYRIVGTEALSWNPTFRRRLVGLRSSGDLFLLLAPS